MKTADKLLALDDLLGLPETPTEVVAVPEWGGSVRIRVLTGAQREAMRDRCFDKDGVFNRNLWERLLLVQCVVEPALDEAQVDALMARTSGMTIHNLIDRINTLCALTSDGGISKDGVDAAEKSFLKG
jgi:hypothetical protein